jgi:hypothetical protein
MIRGQSSPCSFGLSATSQQYFSLRTNQPPAVLFSQNKSASAISQTNNLPVTDKDDVDQLTER